MKKFLAVILATMLVFSIVACGSKKEEKKDDNAVANQTETSTDNTQADVSDEVEEDDANKEDWEIFLDQYEDFADEYIRIRDEYKKIPTDMVMLGEYNEMKAKVADWETKADDWTVTLDGTDNAETFATEYARITAKFAEE